MIQMGITPLPPPVQKWPPPARLLGEKKHNIAKANHKKYDAFDPITNASKSIPPFFYDKTNIQIRKNKVANK